MGLRTSIIFYGWLLFLSGFLYLLFIAVPGIPISRAGKCIRCGTFSFAHSQRRRANINPAINPSIYNGGLCTEYGGENVAQKLWEKPTTLDWI